MFVDYVACGDCLELMKEMPNKCIDVSFTSPPYNTLRDWRHTKYLEAEIDSKDWLEQQCDVIDELLRVTKKYVLINVQCLHGNRSNVYKLIGHYSDRIHDIVIWYKHNARPCGTPNKISNGYEMLLILKCKGVHKVDVNSGFMRNVFETNSKTKNPYSKIHKAVMNREFCDFVISEFTKEGDIVLDPYLGLGTTALSCIEHNRHYVGFELNETYFNIAQQRINEANK